MSEQIQQIAESFAKRWNDAISAFPLLQLDFTWPSIGTLDQITFGLRGKKSLSRSETELLRQAAAYIGVMAAECWSSFRVAPLLSIDQRGVILAGKNEQGAHAVPIEESLRKILLTLPNPIPVLADFKRDANFSYNYLSLYALGVMLGLSPYGEGAWAECTPESFAENIEKAVTTLGRGCVRYYERCFPQEVLGQVGELYLAGLIYPPTGMLEGLPGQFAVRETMKLFDEFQSSPKAMLSLGANLLKANDELLSGYGLILTGALSDSLPARELIAAAETRGTYPGLLRTAMYEARALQGLRGDWVQAEDFLPEDALRFEIEKALGFLPWVYLGIEGIKQKKKDERIGQLLTALAYFDYDGAVDLCDLIVSETPGNIEVRLQRIYLSILNQELDSLESALKALITEPGAESEPRIYMLRGFSALADERAEDAVRYLQEAYSYAPANSALRGEAANDLGWSLFLASRPEEALSFFDESIRMSAQPIPALLNKSFVLRGLEREEEARDVLQACFRIAPTDRRVFAHLLDAAQGG